MGGWLNNQSIVSHTIRMMKWHPPSSELVGLAISGLVLLATMVVCVLIARRGGTCCCRSACSGSSP